MPRTAKTEINDSAERDLFLESFKNDTKKPPKESTINQYRLLYDKIFTHFQTDLEDIDFDEFKEYILTVKSPSTQKNLINLMAMFNNRFGNEEEAKLYMELRQQKFEEITEKLYNVNEELAKSLPKFDLLKKHMKKQVGTGYIINYLLINYFTRNQDLNVIITDTVPDDADLKDENWLILHDDNTVDFIRNKYKTVDKYGTMKYKIDDSKFTAAIKEVLSDQGATRLIPTKQVDYFIRKFTYDKLGEADYLKIQIYDIIDSHDYGKLIEIERRRGSDLKQLISHYNLKFTRPSS